MNAIAFFVLTLGLYGPAVLGWFIGLFLLTLAYRRLYRAG